MLLLVMAALLLSAAAMLPTWPYAARLGYYPSGVSGAVLVAIALMVLAGRL